jgi:hypothetical protein
MRRRSPASCRGAVRLKMEWRPREAGGEEGGGESGEGGGARQAVVVRKQAQDAVTLAHRRDQKTTTTHWLAAGSKDGKVSLWDIY